MMYGEGGVKDLASQPTQAGEMECGFWRGRRDAVSAVAGRVRRPRKRREQAGLWCVVLALWGLLPLAP